MNEKLIIRIAAIAHALLTGGLLWAAPAEETAATFWLESYERECGRGSGVLLKVPTAEADGWPSQNCAAFAERIAALTDPSPEARLALFVARDRIGGNGPDRCGTMRRIAQDMVPEHPFPLFFLATCTRHEEGDELAKRQKAVSLLRRAVAADPEHVLSLVTLISIGEGPAFRGEYPYLTAAEYAKYAASHYRITGDTWAARLAFDAYLDAGDAGRADSIRNNVRDDLSLDVLDLSPTARGGSLSLACSDDLIWLGLADHCLTAFAALIGASAAAGETVPDDVLAHVQDAFRRLVAAARVADGRKDNERFARRLSHSSWAAGRKARGAAGLRALLESHPPPLKSSEHYRVYAGTAPSWGGRIEALRGAVELDGGNQVAKCELAEALVLTGARREAWPIYTELASATDDPPVCPGGEDAMQLVESLEHRGVSSRVSPDDPYPGSATTAGLF